MQAAFIESACGLVRGKPRNSRFNQTDNYVIGNKSPSIHDFLGQDTKFVACLDGSAQHIARRNLWNVETFLNVIRLRAFSRARAA
jgi:hypothetical protein